MKIGMYSSDGSAVAVPGIVLDDDTAVDIRRALEPRRKAPELEGFSAARTIHDYLNAGLDLRRLEALAADHDDSAVERNVRWRPPIARPGKLIGIGLNIPALVGTGTPIVSELPSRAPFWFMKATSSIVVHGDPIVHPGRTHSESVIPEPELGVVIGRLCGPGIATPKAAQAPGYVAGFTICNDVSATDITFNRGGAPFAYNLAWSKCYPSFAPVGPWIEVTGSLDPTGLRVRQIVNGKVIIDANTAQYLWTPWELVEYFAAVCLLEPGDIISCGNFPPIYPLWPGDEVRIKIDGVGELVNPVVAGAQETSYRVPDRVTTEVKKFAEHNTAVAG